jgi:hypothetical protein
MKRLQFIILAFLLLLAGCVEKPSYIDGFAIVYKENVPYLIDLDGNLFSLANYDHIIGDMGEFIIVQKNNKFGYIKSTGEEIVKPIYDMAMPYSDGFAVVKQTNRFFIINTIGDVVFELPYGIESYATYRDGLLLASLDDKYGYFDANGNVAIDFIYDAADSFYEGKAAVAVLENDVLNYGFIEINNQPLTEMKYISVSRFQNGFAAVASSRNQQGYPLYGYINEFGEEVIAPTYAYAYPFSDGLAVVGNYVTRVGGRYTYTFKDYRYIDTTGEIILNPNVTFVGIFYGNFIPGNFQNGVARFFFN